MTQRANCHFVNMDKQTDKVIYGNSFLRLKSIIINSMIIIINAVCRAWSASHWKQAVKPYPHFLA